MTGIELLRELHSFDPDLPVMLITRDPTVETAQEAIEHGVFRYLKKQIPSDLLKRTVGQASRLYRLACAKREALNVHDTLGAGAASRRIAPSFERALESAWIAFQPIVSVSRRKVFGYEALLRSTDPAYPTVGHVLEAAEQLGTLAALGRLVRRKATEAFDGASDDALLFVNLHPKDLVDPNLTAADSPLSRIAHRVVLEVTERSSLAGLRNLPERVAALRELGFRIAVDDLGAGYAGLASFAMLEPEIVKVDMSLTRGIDQSPTKQKVVGSLVALCEDMGKVVVVEGVETVGERDALLELGCDLLQGYLFAKPGPPFPLPEW